jgi:Holliday junction resolvase RusA-like endonuclease
MAHFEYHGPVKGQARPRFGKGRAYERKDMREYKAAIADAYREQVGKSFGGVPLEVSIHAYKPIAKSTPKRVTLQAWKAKPDADNIAKAVLDALKGVAFDDDSQVVQLRIWKHPRARQQQEGLTVYVWEAKENEGSESCI